jgi:hypothetical protein
MLSSSFSSSEEEEEDGLMVSMYVEGILLLQVSLNEVSVGGKEEEVYEVEQDDALL